jgi:hypothetical protein
MSAALLLDKTSRLALHHAQAMTTMRPHTWARAHV